MDDTEKAVLKSRIRGVPHRIPGYGSAEERGWQAPLDPVQLGALRVVGVPYEGSLGENGAAIAAGFQKLRAALDGAGAAVTRDGAPLLLLVDDPFVVQPAKRKYLFAQAVRGPVKFPEGSPLEKRIADGGFFLRLHLAGGLAVLEDAVAFLFGKWFPEHSYQLALPVIRFHLEADPVSAPAEALVTTAVSMFVPTAVRMVKGIGREGAEAG